MNRSTLGAVRAASAGMAVAFLVAACGGEKKPATDTTSAAAASTGQSAAAAAPAAAPAQGPAPGAAPAGATAAMLAQGDSIFHGQAAGGLCFTCHGPDAKGGPLAPPLAGPDKKWLTGDGTYAFIQKRVTEGMPKPTAPYAAPMLPMGGAQLTPDQVKAVSAYVYSISH
jgi:mono/diheme cytochrome c family protein